MISIIGWFISMKVFMSPIFVVGGSRSGTSVLLQAIGKHQHILSMPGEAPLLTSMGGIVHLFENEESTTKEYYNSSLRFTKQYLYRKLRRLSFEITCGSNYGAKFLLKEIAMNPSRLILKRRWAAKTFPDEKVARGLVHLFPKAKFLYIVRNGVDVVSSATKFRGFRDNSFLDNCTRWRNSIFSFRYLTRMNDALVLRHEDLVANPQRFFSIVFNFLGEPNDPKAEVFVSSTFIHPQDKDTQAGIAVKEALLGRKPSYHEWTAAQRHLFRDVCAEAMAEAGYKIPF